mgnify:CR=1 FL=1|jgi:hypothetical protein
MVLLYYSCVLQYFSFLFTIIDKITVKIPQNFQTALHKTGYGTSFQLVAAILQMNLQIIAGDGFFLWIRFFLREVIGRG